jgi:hypothetical protein
MVFNQREYSVMWREGTERRCEFDRRCFLIWFDLMKFFGPFDVPTIIPIPKFQVQFQSFPPLEYHVNH